MRLLDQRLKCFVIGFGNLRCNESQRSHCEGKRIERVVNHIRQVKLQPASNSCKKSRLADELFEVTYSVKSQREVYEKADRNFMNSLLSRLKISQVLFSNHQTFGFLFRSILLFESSVPFSGASLIVIGTIIFVVGLGELNHRCLAPARGPLSPNKTQKTVKKQRNGSFF